MPRTSGTYTLPVNSVSPAVPRTTINPVDFNTLTDDIETALNSTPASQAQTSTDNAVVRFNGTTGGTQDSGVTVDDANAVQTNGASARFEALRTTDAAGALTLTAGYGTGSVLGFADAGNNSIIGFVNNNSSTLAIFPTGVTGHGELNQSGSSVFGLFGDAVCNVAGVATNEVNSKNMFADPPGTYPPDNSFGITHALPIALQVVSFGDYKSEIGVAINAGGPQFNTGLYVYSGAAALTGIFVDATSSVGAPTAVKARIVGGSSDRALAVDVMGTGAATSAWLEQTWSSATRLLAYHDGSMAVGTLPSVSGKEARLGVYGGATVRGIDNTTAVFGVEAGANNAISGVVQVGVSSGNAPFIAAGRLHDGTPTPLSIVTDAAIQVSVDTVGVTTTAGLGVGTTVSSAAFLKIAAGTTAKSQINLPVSTAPTSPNDGDMWREDNTNTGLKIRVNGVTKTVLLG